jgi:hypothetical protein
LPLEDDEPDELCAAGLDDGEESFLPDPSERSELSEPLESLDPEDELGSEPEPVDSLADPSFEPSLLEFVEAETFEEPFLESFE